ncbi:MAG: BON domain-containing protein [Gammaproteobacteria bacterium]
MKYLIIPTGIMILTSIAASADQNEAEQMSDVWLKAKIVTVYTLSEHLNPFDLEVEVASGRVVLTGTVENDIERDLAGELAKGVKGVIEVDNQLDINSDAKRDTDRSSFLHYVEDANITARVKTRLLLNRNTQALKIRVSTKNGVVLLEGELNSDIQGDLARQIVRNTEGVIDVQDNLTISDKQ